MNFKIFIAGIILTACQTSELEEPQNGLPNKGKYRRATDNGGALERGAVIGR